MPGIHVDALGRRERRCGIVFSTPIISKYSVKRDATFPLAASECVNMNL